jgi:hypothetical protein
MKNSDYYIQMQSNKFNQTKLAILKCLNPMKGVR